MNTEEMQKLHEKVWNFRREMQDVWPTPDTLDSLRFAFTEAGEAMDAYLRTKGGYARNHAKEPDLYGELADCALMLFTALGPFNDEWDHTNIPTEGSLENLSHYVTEAMCEYGAYYDAWRILCGLAIGTIARYPGMDLSAELDKRLARIRAKHRPA